MGEYKKVEGFFSEFYKHVVDSKSLIEKPCYEDDVYRIQYYEEEE